MFRKLLLGFITCGFVVSAFLVPVSLANLPGAQGVTVTTSIAHAETDWDEESGEVDCAWTNVFCGLAKFTTGIWMFVSQLVLVVTGLVLDIAIDFSLSSQNYKQNVSGFIDTGWTIVRDITNILFIFGLLVAAFSLILGTKADRVGVNSDPKRIVVWIIIMALLVNFSLFFTKIIIDAGNIFGRVFYDRIAVVNTGNSSSGQSTSEQDQNTIIESLTNYSTEKSIALGIINKSNPQRLILGNQALNNQMAGYSGWSLVIFHLFISFLVFIFNLGIISVFAVMIFVFFGRTFGLWVNMIMSPLAFVLEAVPVKFLEEFKFEKWLSATVSYSLLAPVFMFFVYLALIALNTPINFDTENLIGAILSVAINLIAALFIIMKGKTFALKMSGELGAMIGKFGGMASGLALGAVTGGTAFLARQTLGRAGAAVANSETLSNIRAKGIGASKFGGPLGRGVDMIARNAARTTIQTGKAVDKSSLDLRNANVMGQTLEGSMQRLDKDFKTGNTFQRNIGYTAGKEEDAKKKKEQIEREAAEVISSQQGALQQDIDRKKAKLKGVGPMADDERDALKKVKDAEDKVKAAEKDRDESPEGKAIKKAQEELTTYTEDTAEEFKKFRDAIKEAEVDIKRASEDKKKITNQLKKPEAELTKLNNIAPANRTQADNDRHAALTKEITGLKDARAQADKDHAEALTAKNNVSTDARYVEIKDKKAELTKNISTAKNNDDYKTLEKAVTTAKTNVSTAKKDPVIERMNKDVKDAEKKFNDTQVSRLESIADRSEKWVDTKTFGNSTFNKGVDPAGRAGRAYEGFAGSTKGMRQGAESVREKIKGYKKPPKKDEKKP